MLSILLFIIESIAYRACNDRFYTKLAIFAFSFPGALVAMVPFHKVEGSAELVNLLQFLLMLSPLPLIQIYFVAENKIGKIVRYVFSKFNYTIWISLWVIVAVTFFSGIFAMLIEKSFLHCFSMVFIGFLGSTYECTL